MTEDDYNEVTLERILPVELTDEERKDYVGKLSNSTVRINNLKDELSAAKKYFTGRINGYLTTQAHVATIVNDNKHEAQVEVLVHVDYVQKRYTERRLDTNDITIDRDATPDELQPELALT